MPYVSTTSRADNDNDDDDNDFITTRFNASKLVLNRAMTIMTVLDDT